MLSRAGHGQGPVAVGCGFLVEADGQATRWIDSVDDFAGIFTRIVYGRTEVCQPFNLLGDRFRVVFRRDRYAQRQWT